MGLVILSVSRCLIHDLALSVRCGMWLEILPEGMVCLVTE